jgi:hypothetical protein
MKQLLALTLSGALCVAPALPLLADEQAPAPAPAAAAATPDATSKAPDAQATVKSDAPDLPDAKADASQAPEDVTGTAEPEVPKEDLATPGKERMDVPESRFKTRNFVLGFLGGAAVGAAAGVLVFSNGANNGYDPNLGKVNVPVAALVGGLGGGLVAMLLGATTPEEAKPPKVEGQAPAQGVLAGLNVSYDWRF